MSYDNIKFIQQIPVTHLECAVTRCVLADRGEAQLPPDLAPYWRAFKNPSHLHWKHSHKTT